MCAGGRHGHGFVRLPGTQAREPMPGDAPPAPPTTPAEDGAAPSTPELGVGVLPSVPAVLGMVWIVPPVPEGPMLEVGGAPGFVPSAPGERVVPPPGAALKFVVPVPRLEPALKPPPVPKPGTVPSEPLEPIGAPEGVSGTVFEEVCASAAPARKERRAIMIERLFEPR